MADQPPLLVIAGATATGKTGLAIRVAQAMVGEGIVAEVISADSRQVYRGLDIGTAKASMAERAGVRHHGLDLVDPDERFTLADYATHAREALARIAARGGLAILAGGTGLYLRAIARGIDTDALPADPELRARLEDDLGRDGLEALVARLRARAPDRAAATDLRNPRRVVRALEIAELKRGGGPLPVPHEYAGPLAWLGLTVDPPTHRTWIANRARAQFAAGLIDEAAALRERFDPGLPAFSAIGYREAWGVLDGLMSREEAMAQDIHRNVGFARRQRTWFQAEPGIRWLDTGAGTADAAIAAARRLMTEG